MSLKVFIYLLISVTVVINAYNVIYKDDVQYVRKILSKIPKNDRALFLAGQMHLGYAKAIPLTHKVDENVTEAIFQILTKGLRSKMDFSTLLACEPICFTRNQCIDPCDQNIYPP